MEAFNEIVQNDRRQPTERARKRPCIELLILPSSSWNARAIRFKRRLAIRDIQSSQSRWEPSQA